MSGTLSSGRPGGNPEFGTKYKLQPKGEEPLTEKVTVRISEKTKEFLDSLGKEYADFVREAIAEKIGREAAQTTKTETTELELVGQQQQHSQTSREGQPEETNPTLGEPEATPRTQRRAGQTQRQKPALPKTQTRSRKNTATEKTTEQDH